MAYKSSRRLDPKAVAYLILLRFGIVGCHRTAQYPIRETPDAGFGSATIAVGADECPEVVFTATPSSTYIGEPIRVSARASDADFSDQLAYSWTASVGSLANPDSADAIYTCPGRDHAGPQTITLSVSDGSCVTTHEAKVFCYALADGGGPATTGSGGAGDAGANCAHGDPTTCEGPLCNQCTNDNCDTLANAAAGGGTPTAGCDIFVSDDQQARCQRLYACMRDSGCVQNNDPSKCWCGSVDAYECETGMQPGTGPCLRELIDAAGSSDATVINQRLTDSSFPIGAAINLASCRSVSCSRLSDPPNPVCQL
jgi:hypothetical protein